MYQKSFAIVSRNKINDFKKKIYVDSDKSISIRAFLFSAISENISIIKNRPAYFESENHYTKDYLKTQQLIF